MSRRYCIVGLGNPGARYQKTRHNIGFEWVEAVRSSLFPKEKWTEKYESLWFRSTYEWENESFDLHFILPQTFMNESGRAAALWREKNQGDHRFLCVYDEMDLALGRLRFREKGSDGGHRGMRSLIERLGTTEIPRLRIGIGRPEQSESVEYVLDKFKPEEQIVMKRLLQDAPEQLKIFLRESTDKTMNLLNSKDFAK